MGISDEIANLRRAIMQLDLAIEQDAQGLDAREACKLLVSLHEAKTELGVVYSTMEKAVADAMGRDEEVVLDDGSRIEKKFDPGRKGWKHKDLASVVSEKLSMLAIDMDTGEVVMSPQEVAERVLDYVQPSYWRIKKLAELGINADNYCELGEPKTSIAVRRAK